MDTVDRFNAALDGRYRIECELGEGGMARVYLAEDLKHERKVALKVLKPELAAVLGAERFLAEIRTTANLQHPHILPLHDSGEVDGLLYYVMPYVEGESLRDRLDREGQLPVDEAVAITLKVADALHEAHERGVIHRDVKPSNILLAKGEPLLTDFGIALATEPRDRRLTETGMSVGTPAYMSPEQGLEQSQVGRRSDVYSLACVLYEMLVGDPPFAGSNALAVLARKSTEAPPSLRTVRASIPEPLERAVLHALARVPADRFETAADFARAIASGDPVDMRAQPARFAPPLRRGIAVAAVVVSITLGGWWLAVRSAESTSDVAAPRSPVPEAQQAYDVAAAHFLDYTTETSLRSALEGFEHAIDLDPAFALAYAKASQAHAWMWHYGFDPRDRRDARIAQAEVRADEAERIDPDLVDAQLAQGLWHLVSDRDALPYYRRALELDPDNAEIALQVGYLWQELGQGDSAVVYFERSIFLDPRDPNKLAAAVDHYIFARDVNAGRVISDRALVLAGGPSAWRHNMQRARLEILAGDVQRAVEWVRGAINAMSGEVRWSAFRPVLLIAAAVDEDVRRTLMEAGPTPPIPTGTEADYFLVKAELARMSGDALKAEVYADSALAVLEPIIGRGLEGERPIYEAIVRLHTALALATLGRSADALREAEAARARIPIDRYAAFGTDAVETLARVHTLVGDPEVAIDLLEGLLEMPSNVSRNRERLSPWWTPLHGNPRFELLFGGT